MNTTTAGAPDRTHAQRMEALSVANRHRTRRAQFKQQLKQATGRDARRRVVAALIDVPDWMATMKTVDLLMAVPRVGRVKSNQILMKVKTSPSRTLGGLTERQRDMLVELITTLPATSHDGLSVTRDTLYHSNGNGRVEV